LEGSSLTWFAVLVLDYLCLACYHQLHDAIIAYWNTWLYLCIPVQSCRFLSWTTSLTTWVPICLSCPGSWYHI